MGFLTLVRSRRVRRALGLLTLFYLLGATLEPAAHAMLDAADGSAPAEDTALWSILGADSSPDDSDRDTTHDKFECVLCHIAGSGFLNPSEVPALAPSEPRAAISDARAPPLVADPATEGQPRAPPVISLL